METHCFNLEDFANGKINFEINIQPVSLQNNTKKKKAFKDKIQKITKTSEFIITNTVWVHVDYYCSHIRRFKNPGIYDMDNIIKPILDSLCGLNGIILDDVLADRITINWIDSKIERIEITAEYPNLSFLKKQDLVILRSHSNWCYPISKTLFEISEISKLLSLYFNKWESINSENDYYDCIGTLPIQNFIHYSKLRESGFEFIDFIPHETLGKTIE